MKKIKSKIVDQIKTKKDPPQYKSVFWIKNLLKINNYIIKVTC